MHKKTIFLAIALIATQLNGTQELEYLQRSTAWFAVGTSGYTLGGSAALVAYNLWDGMEVGDEGVFLRREKVLPLTIATVCCVASAQTLAVFDKVVLHRWKKDLRRLRNRAIQCGTGSIAALIMAHEEGWF